MVEQTTFIIPTFFFQVDSMRNDAAVEEKSALAGCEQIFEAESKASYFFFSFGIKYAKIAGPKKR